MASKVKLGELDLVEIRVDALLDHLPSVKKLLPVIGVPILLTVRHPAEGGMGNLPVTRRRELIRRFLGNAAVLDVELRSAQAMREVIDDARARGITVVFSDHHFRRTPTLAQMRTRRERAFRAGADIFKIACLADGGSAVARLLDLVSEGEGKPVAAMGMGKLGQASRLVLACAGSVLNYGYLDRPNAPGQWEARELKGLLRQMGR